MKASTLNLPILTLLAAASFPTFGCGREDTANTPVDPGNAVKRFVPNDQQEIFNGYVATDPRHQALVTSFDAAYQSLVLAESLANTHVSNSAGSPEVAIYSNAHAESAQQILRDLGEANQAIRTALRSSDNVNHRWHLAQLGKDLAVVRATINNREFSPARPFQAQFSVGGTTHFSYRCRESIHQSMDQLCGQGP